LLKAHKLVNNEVEEEEEEEKEKLLASNG